MEEIRILDVDELPDWDAVASVFNHFVVSSPAAYPDEKIPPAYFARKREDHREYPFLVAARGGKILGFGYLGPFHPARTMRRSATLTYFLLPECSGLGLGSKILERLIAGGRAMGVETFLAHISSLNEGSIRFHRNRGFEECGRFRRVGVKGGQEFDMVWMQRIEE